jgi:neutral trehalase
MRLIPEISGPMPLDLLLVVMMATSSFTLLPQDGIYCTGRLLNMIQMSRLFNDSKHFVDLPLNSDPGDVLIKFEQRFPDDQPAPTKSQLAEFVTENFGSQGAELEVAAPVDWTSDPTLFASLTDPTLLQFARFLNDQWKELGRKQVAAVASSPQRFSTIPLPHPFIVAGGRFREMYYWDSYWICKGLIAVDMHQSALNMLLNMISLINRYGYVPNGGRIYYRTRSQPPVAALIAEDLLENGMLQNKSVLQKILPALDKEYAWFMANRSVVLRNNFSDASKASEASDASDADQAEAPHKGGAGGGAILNRYYSSEKIALNLSPRPESYYEDRSLADSIGNSSSGSAEALYRELRSGAESGWDYSSRWIRKDGAKEREKAGEKEKGGGEEEKEREKHNSEANEGNSGDANPEWPLDKLAVQSILPVCLNSILCRVEAALAKLHSHLATLKAADAAADADADAPAADDAAAADDADAAVTAAAAAADEGDTEGAVGSIYYRARAATRRQAMAKHMWDNEAAQWRDIDAKTLQFVQGDTSEYQSLHSK